MRSVNFARWNHVLIPATKDGRDRLRGRWAWKLAWPLAATYGALSDDGRTLAALAITVGGLSFDVGHTEIYVLAGMLLAVLVASIAARPAYALDAVVATVDAPRRVLMGESVVFGVTLANEGAKTMHALRVSGPFLPWDGQWTSGAPGVPRLRPGERARVEMKARFVARGEHHLDSFHAAALVPLGLAKGRGVETTGARFLVLPHVARIQQLVLPETRRAELGGAAPVSRAGESMELHGIRPYRAGDPARHLHARSWARTGRPMVREFEEELLRRVAVVVDADRRDEARMEAAISLAAGVVSHLARGEAVIDLLVAGERVHDLTLGRHIGFLEQALDLLACFEPPATPPEDARALLAQLEPHLPRLSCVVLVEAGESVDRAAAVAECVRVHRVGCVWLRVGDGRDVAAAKGAKAVSVGAIARGEELWL
jgi:uncharacterized protein (DUF58 family)